MDLSDPWVLAALRGDLDREAYAAFLGDGPHAELLRLAIRLDAAGTDDPAGRARIAALRAELDDDMWWRLFAPPGWILGCRGKPPRDLLQMAVECDRSWPEMVPTTDPEVRHCAACRQQVFRVTTREAAEAHAHAGHCISAVGAAARAIGSAAQNAAVTGRPHAPSYWARSLIRR